MNTLEEKKIAADDTAQEQTDSKSDLSVFGAAVCGLAVTSCASVANEEALPNNMSMGSFDRNGLPTAIINQDHSYLIDYGESVELSEKSKQSLAEITQSPEFTIKLWVTPTDSVKPGENGKPVLLTFSSNDFKEWLKVGKPQIQIDGYIEKIDVFNWLPADQVGKYFPTGDVCQKDKFGNFWTLYVVESERDGVPGYTVVAGGTRPVADLGKRAEGYASRDIGHLSVLANDLLLEGVFAEEPIKTIEGFKSAAGFTMHAKLDTKYIENYCADHLADLDDALCGGVNFWGLKEYPENVYFLDMTIIDGRFEPSVPDRIKLSDELLAVRGNIGAAGVHELGHYVYSNAGRMYWPNLIKACKSFSDDFINALNDNISIPGAHGGHTKDGVVEIFSSSFASLVPEVKDLVTWKAQMTALMHDDPVKARSHIPQYERLILAFKKDFALHEKKGHFTGLGSGKEHMQRLLNMFAEFKEPSQLAYNTN